MGEESKQENAKEETKKEEKKEEKVEEKKEEKADEKKEEKADEKKEEEKEEEAKPPVPCVLFVDLHCMGCAKKIERSISKIKGVESVVIDMAKNEVTIKGVVEPQVVCNKIMTRTKRNAKVLSPIPEAGGEPIPIPQVVASQVSGLTTVELNVNMHCEACAEQLKRMILKMKGVNTAETEFSSSKLTVKGTMDADQLVDYVYRRTKKQAKIVPQPEPEKPPEETPKTEEKKEEEKPAEEAKPDEKKDGENVAEETNEELKNVEEQIMQHKMMYQYNYQPVYVIERIPAPQLFSDENPNACSVM